MDLPVPEGPQTTTFSCRLTHSRVRSPFWVGVGIEERAGFQASNVLPVGRRALRRRLVVVELSRPVSSAMRSALMISAGAHRWAFAVMSTSGATARR